MQSLEQGVRFVHGVLEIIEYPKEKRELYIAKFFIAIEMKCTDRFRYRLSNNANEKITNILNTQAKTFEEFEQKNREIKEILLAELTEKEVTIIYLEVLKDYIEDWIEQLSPTLSKEMSEKILSLSVMLMSE